MAEIIQQTDKKTIYREGKTLVKLFKNNYPKSDVLNEALNTARVEEGTSLNVPPCTRSPRSTANGRSFSTTSKAKRSSSSWTRIPKRKISI